MTEIKLIFYDDEGSLMAPSLNGRMSAGVRASLEPQGGAVIPVDGFGELLSGSARVVADNAIGGVLQFSSPALGMAGVGASDPVEGFIAPMNRNAEENSSTGVPIASIGNPVTLRFTLLQESWTP